MKYDEKFLKLIWFALSLFLGIAILSTVINVHMNYSRVTLRKEIRKFIEIMISGVPPSLFFTMVMGALVISKRLEEKNITCLVESSYFKVGRVKMVCLDKTGTLTTNSIKISGYSIVENRAFEETQQNVKDLLVFENSKDFITLMAVCHGLNQYGEEVVGDPMEVEMFKATNFRFQNDQSIVNPEGFDEANKMSKIIPN